MQHGRKKIWELPDLQCPVVGTCLSMAELRKLARKADLDISPQATDYEVHSYCVSMAKRDCFASRLIGKALDKKFARTLRRFSSAKSPEALLALWREAADAGDIPGPFWAVMSHPHASDEVILAVFGEVHMLSHLVGAANRADIRRLTSLEQSAFKLRNALGRMKTLLRSARDDSAARIAALEKELAVASAERGELAEELARLNELGPSPVTRLLEELAGLREMVDEQAESLREQSLENLRLKERLGELARERELLREERRALALERERAEQELDRLLGGFACPEGGCSQNLAGLCGKRILYIGGRSHLVRHYRALIERFGGEFEHHDGGLEEACAALQGKLSRAEAVLCPVDCVSHEACLAVKRVCKRSMKPFLPLRSAGLSTLVRTLRDLEGGAGSAQ